MVNIDTVYQRVLSIANKEQRGYITPQEFNLIANQAQQDIFEQYFYDLDQFKRKQNAPAVQFKSDETSFSEMIELIQNKLKPFTTLEAVVTGFTFPIVNMNGNPVYRTGRLFHFGREIKLVEINDLQNILASTFHRAALADNPVYIREFGGRDIEVYTNLGLTIAGISVELIVAPPRVAWGYNVIGEKALYNANTSIDFDLHASEEPELLNKILGLAGIVINKPGLASIAGAQEAARIQQQKL